MPVVPPDQNPPLERPLDSDPELWLRWDFVNIEIPPLAPVRRHLTGSRNKHFFLPLELWFVIFSYSTFAAIKTLSLTCKILRSSVLPLLFHDVRLRVRGELWQRHRPHTLSDTNDTQAGNFVTRLHNRYKRPSPTKKWATAINQKLRTRLEFYVSEQIAPVITRFFVDVKPEDFDESRGGEDTVDFIFSSFPLLPNLAFIAFHGTTFTPRRLQVLLEQSSTRSSELKTMVIDQCFSPSGHIDISSLLLTGLQVSRQTSIVVFNHDSVESLQVDGPELSSLQSSITLPLLRTLSTPWSYLTTFLTQHDCPSLSSITTYGAHQTEPPDTLPPIPLRSFTGPAFLAAILSSASGSKLHHADLSSCDSPCPLRCSLSQSLLQLSRVASMQLVTLTLRSQCITHVVWNSICTFERLEEIRVFTEPQGDWEVSELLRSFCLHQRD